MAKASRVICIDPCDDDDILERGEEYEVTGSDGTRLWLRGVPGAFYATRFVFAADDDDTPAPALPA